MNRLEQIKYLLSKKETRIKLLEKDLFLFWLYYFTDVFKSPSASFHKQWAKDLMSTKHIELIGFRESGKTVWATIKVINNIVFRVKRFIMVYSYDKTKATGRLYDIAVHLQTNRKLIEDYGELFPNKRVEEDATQKRSIPDFITRNDIKVKASWIWESPRWLMFFAKDWSFRPDYILLDDIDVDKSVGNIEIIEKNYSWLKWELLWWMSEDCQILFLWNIIKSDWIVPRFEQEFKNSKDWIVRRQAIIEDGKITWSRFTEKSLKKRKDLLWEISYNQNYLLIPFSWGETIIKRHQIQYFNNTQSYDNIYIWIDPAISQKTKSDPFAITVTWVIWDNIYVLEAIELTWTNKDPFNAVKIIKGLYVKYKANRVVVETVAFQQVMSKLLSQEEIAVLDVRPHNDKITRLLEHQYLFEQNKVFFKSWSCDDLVKQLLDFPNVLHDDLVDSFVYSIPKAPELDIYLF